MKYLVEVHASMERGNALDAAGGPGPVFAHIAERFKPEAIYGNPTRRQAFGPAIEGAMNGPAMGRPWS